MLALTDLETMSNGISQHIAGGNCCFSFCDGYYTYNVADC